MVGHERWTAAWMPVLVWTVILMPLARPAAARTDLPPLAEVVAGVQSQYDGLTDLRARFVQEITLKTMKRTNREAGTLYWKRPGRMLWHYDAPQGKKLIIGQRQAWLYVPEERAVYVKKTGSLLNSQTAVRLFSGLARLQDDFTIRFAEPTGKDREGNLLLLLSPKGSETGTSDIVVTVDPERRLILRCRFLDIYGNVTRLSLEQIQTNVQLPESLFLFRPPPGVEVRPMP